MQRCAVLLVIAVLATPSAAFATITRLFGGAAICSRQLGVNAGERHCSGLFSTFDGAPIDVNVAFPPAPSAGPDGNFPIVGIFHSWAAGKYSTTSIEMQEWLDRGYAVFSMTDRGWSASCGGLDPKQLVPGVCDNGYNHVMDTRYEVRDAQEVFEALADQAATGALHGEGLINPQAIAVMGASYGGGISMALAALKNRKMMGAHEGAPNLDGYLVPWISPRGRLMQIAAAQPDIAWTDLAYSLQPNGHSLDYVADAPYLQRGRIGVLKQSWVAGFYAVGRATLSYAPAGTDPDADLDTWYATASAGEPYDVNAVVLDIADELSRHHSSYYIDNSTAPAPLLISSGFTDDVFPADEAVRFYNRTRSVHPQDPVSLIFSDRGHQRAQNKAEDAAYLAAQRRIWFDFYLKGTGPAPFHGVQALTQVCGGPSQGPFRAPTWAALAPGELRVESAPMQVIASIVPSDAPVARAYDPITGNGACATTTSVDQVGAATYRSAPARPGGFTLMGSPTIVADIQSSGPTVQVAARLLDVDPVRGTQTLIARGLYRPEVRPLAASCQVFQLHPNGWKFEEGHIVKLELLPADQPYGRISNGQTPITISNLRLRLPVLETPDGGSIEVPSPKVLPQGYSLAGDVAEGIDDTCISATPTTTSTTTSSTTTTSDTTTTTTATLPAYALDLRIVKIRARSADVSSDGRLVAKGEMEVPPDFGAPPPFTVRIQDSDMLDAIHNFQSCSAGAKARIECHDQDGDGEYRAIFRPRGDTVRFKVSFRGQSISLPLAGPVTMTLLHNSAVVRTGTNGDCQAEGSTLKCGPTGT